MATTYIINGAEYTGRKSEILDCALYDHNCKAVYIKGNDNHHWRYNSSTGNWYLACN